MRLCCLLVHSEFVCWHAFLTSRGIDCQPVNCAVRTGLKCDSKGKLGGEEIPLTFRTDPEFRKTPIGGRFDRQEIIFASDRKDSFAFCFVSADVRIENFWVNRDFDVFCVRRFGQRKIRPEQMPRDVSDVSNLVREHDDADARLRIVRHYTRVTERGAQGFAVSFLAGSDLIH